MVQSFYLQSSLKFFFCTCDYAFMLQRGNIVQHLPLNIALLFSLFPQPRCSFFLKSFSSPFLHHYFCIIICFSPTLLCSVLGAVSTIASSSQLSLHSQFCTMFHLLPFIHIHFAVEFLISISFAMSLRHFLSIFPRHNFFVAIISFLPVALSPFPPSSLFLCRHFFVVIFDLCFYVAMSFWPIILPPLYICNSLFTLLCHSLGFVLVLFWWRFRFLFLIFFSAVSSRHFVYQLKAFKSGVFMWFLLFLTLFFRSLLFYMCRFFILAFKFSLFIAFKFLVNLRQCVIKAMCHKSNVSGDVIIRVNHLLRMHFLFLFIGISYPFENMERVFFNEEL